MNKRAMLATKKANLNREQSAKVVAATNVSPGWPKPEQQNYTKKANLRKPIVLSMITVATTRAIPVRSK